MVIIVTNMNAKLFVNPYVERCLKAQTHFHFKR